MLVPRSFKYSSSPPAASQSPPRSVNESKPKSTRLFSEPAWSSPLAVSSRPPPPPPPAHRLSESPDLAGSPTMTNMRSPSKPVEIPSPRSPKEFESTRSRGQQHMSRKQRTSRDLHRTDSLPPAVAALLAVTAIPPPRRQSQGRRKRSSLNQQKISIDELVQEWKSEPLNSSFGSSASLGLLLEPTEESADERSSYSRSSSCDSLPSLDGDDSSVMSIGSPATPESIRSQRSSSVTPSRKEKHISLVEPEDCGLDHPLGLDLDLGEDWDSLGSITPKAKDSNRRKSSSFKSNLTSSLQALKSRALSSISSLNRAMDQADASFTDESLWQHPYLFPRLSSEVRPIAFQSTPTRSQRRYLNPMPLSFDEQQHHWRLALSTFAEDSIDTPMIQMQTYRRSVPSTPRKARRNSGSPDPRSEAGRALANAAPQPGRQREVRENSNFLRVIVLEMNMRRKGKLEETSTGKARIWLPPRKVAIVREDVFDDEADDEAKLIEGPIARRVPKRWVGVSADY